MQQRRWPMQPVGGVQRVTAEAVLRKVPGKALPFIHEWIANRRDRHVYQLTDGRRSMAEIARLLRLDAVDVASSMRRLSEGGYVEQYHADEKPR